MSDELLKINKDESINVIDMKESEMPLDIEWVITALFYPLPSVNILKNGMLINRF